MITNEELAELMLLPLTTFGADPEIFSEPGWGIDWDGEDNDDE